MRLIKVTTRAPNLFRNLRVACGAALAGGLLVTQADSALACSQGAYANTFYSNDFSYLDTGCDPDKRDRFARVTDTAKRLSFGPNVTADFGGEFRLRYHNEQGHALSRLNGQDDTFTLSRLRLYANVEVGDRLRFFGEIIDARSYGESFGPRGIEEVHWDALNAFAEFRGQRVGVRFGRQELQFGAQRLVSPLDWGNTRRSFDGVRVDFTGNPVRVSAWYTAPRQITAGFGSRTDDNTRFGGVYATYTQGTQTTLDGYLLHLENDPSDREIWTVGARYAGSRGNTFWELEGAFQFGDQAGSDVRASMLTAGVGYMFKDHPWQPKVSLYYDRASGDDDPTDGRIETFNQLFPLAHAYFGFIDLVGRQNIEAVSLRAQARPHRRLQLAAALHHFRLNEAADGLYNAGGATIRSDPTGASGRDVGNELDLTATVSLSDRAAWQVGYARFWGGSFVTATNPAGVSGDAEFVYTQFRVRF